MHTCVVIEVKRFGAPLGAGVYGVDVRSIDDDLFGELRRAFLEHHVLAFRGQDLSVEDQLVFAARWGTLQCHPYTRDAQHPELIRLENRGKRSNPNEHWHSDMSYEATPPKITMLYAIEAPEIGGDTAFANQHHAFAALSEPLQQHLRMLNGVHTAEGLAPAESAGPDRGAACDTPGRSAPRGAR